MVNKKFIKLKYFLEEELHEIATAYLADLPFIGITSMNDEFEIHFDLDKFDDKTQDSITFWINETSQNSKLISKDVIDDKNWNEEWEKNVPVIVVNDNIAITPSWKQDEVEKPIKIIINPKMSFGTGEHATTRLMCIMLEENVKKDEFWIDAGTGTGVLAILTVKLGAKSCFAFDNNHWSYLNAQENIKLNNCESIIDLQEIDIDEYTLPKSDGIVANLFVHLILDSMKSFSGSIKSGGKLLISGILKFDEDKVLSSAKEHNFKHIKTIYEDEWAGFLFEAL